jgi:hypothetical protein
MNALRRGGAAGRLRAVLLLIAFAIGSIFARDALLVQQIYAMQAELDAPEYNDAPEVRPGEVRVKLRPSGISRRTAMSPTDPPDDDDELDEDSDTLAAVHVVAGVAPAVLGSISAAFISADLPPCAQRALAQPSFTTSISSRGPPTTALAG